uniref:Uncharacterized protein n=1 Tax=Glossina palpalis gambiensis TaxID=67801 RepID=A0A1B0ANE1_9MUSC
MDQMVRHHLLRNLANLAATSCHNPLVLSPPQSQQTNLLSPNAFNSYAAAAAAAAVSQSRVPSWRPFFRLCSAPGLLTCDNNSFLIYRQRILSASVAQTADTAILAACAPLGAPAAQHHFCHLAASNHLILPELNNKSLASRSSAATTAAAACRQQQNIDLQNSILPLCDGITSNLPASPQTDGDESNEAFLLSGDVLYDFLDGACLSGLSVIRYSVNGEP